MIDLTFDSDWRTFGKRYSWADLTLLEAGVQIDRLARNFIVSGGLLGFHACLKISYGAPTEEYSRLLASLREDFDVCNDPDNKPGGTA